MIYIIYSEKKSKPKNAYGRKDASEVLSFCNEEPKKKAKKQTSYGALHVTYIQPKRKCSLFNWLF